VRQDIRERELLSALLARELEPGSDCLDAGAHAGDVIAECARLAPQGRHIAWEPLPELAAEIRARLPGVEVREAALSDRAGDRAFFRIPSDPGWSGFKVRPLPGRAEDPRAEELAVATERLDDALPPGMRPAFLKVDVEGAEEQVLRGALNTLRTHRPVVVFEHGLGSADHYDTAPEAIFDLLTGAGYAIGGVDGDGPYDRGGFAQIFQAGERVNFVARPSAEPGR
jgi:FkbM family methyltransferase